MSNTTKRILLCVLAVLLILLPVLSACTENDPGTDPKTEETKPQNEGANDKDIYGNDRVDSGHAGFRYDDDFTVFVSGNWGTENIWLDEESYNKTDEVQSAVITRNRRLSEQFGINIKEVAIKDDSFVSYITNSVNAADGEFDAISTSCVHCVELALDGYLLDLKTLDTVQLDKPWWDQKMISQCTMDDQLFWVTGEYTTTDNSATHAMAFNKKMFKQNAEKLGEKTPYDYVNDGTWTIDTLFRLAAAVGADSDGNSRYDENDLYGFCYPQTACFAFFNCCGIQCGSIHDTQPLITYDFWSEKTNDVWEKVIDMTNQSWSYDWHNEMHGSDAGTMFMTDHTLFYATYIKQLTELRAAAADFEFGILPYPKYNVEQEEYYSPFHEYGTPFLCLPVSSLDPAASGACIDLLSYESMYTLTPAYYTITLEGKLTRDTESLEMLSLIFTTKVYDFGWISDWGKINSTVMSRYVEKADNLASVVASKNKQVSRAIDKQLEAYQNFKEQNG